MYLETSTSQNVNHQMDVALEKVDQLSRPDPNSSAFSTPILSRHQLLNFLGPTPTKNVVAVKKNILSWDNLIRTLKLSNA